MRKHPIQYTTYIHTFSNMWKERGKLHTWCMYMVCMYISRLFYFCLLFLRTCQTRRVYLYSCAYVLYIIIFSLSSAISASIIKRNKSLFIYPFIHSFVYLSDL